jgi:energy-coupling factor transporter ATP-binding protein EcfA2
MNTFTRIFKTYNLKEVYTPNTAAKLTYIKREIIENDLEKYISLPGKQIFIYGHSGSGKTTLLRNKLKEVNQNFIRTHCETSTTFDEILLQAFDDLNRFYISEKSSNSQYSISSELKAEYQLINSSIKATNSVSKGHKTVRIVPPQLTPQKLASFLGEIDCVWIIEDFHKVILEEKQRIADVVKIFIDSANDFENVKIICIGAVGTARELIELDDNLNTRVAELYVPLLTNKEIEKIVKKGNNLMNIKMSDNLIDKIVYYSNNLASITHQVCYDLCFDKNLKKSSIFSSKLDEDVFKTAVNSYVRKNSDTYNKLYESILCQTYGWNILKTFDYKEKEYLTFDEIKRGIPNDKRPTVVKLENYLHQLGSSEYNAIIRYDRNSKKYSISTPFFRAFLKMKLALEKSELEERNKRRNNKKQKKYNIDKPKENFISNMMLDEDFFKIYYQYLDSYIIKDLKNKEELDKLRTTKYKNNKG